MLAKIVCMLCKMEILSPNVSSVDRSFSREGEEGCQEAAQEGCALQVLRAEHLQGRHRARTDVPISRGKLYLNFEVKL